MQQSRNILDVYSLMSGSRDDVVIPYLLKLVNDPECHKYIPAPILKHHFNMEKQDWINKASQETKDYIFAHKDPIIVDLLFVMTNHMLSQVTSPGYFIKGLVWQKIVGMYNPTSTTYQEILECPEKIVKAYTGPKFLIPYIVDAIKQNQKFRKAIINYLIKYKDGILSYLPSYVTATRRIHNHILDFNNDICHTNALCDGTRYECLPTKHHRDNYRFAVAVATDTIYDRLKAANKSTEEIWKYFYEHFVLTQADINIVTDQDQYTVTINGESFPIGRLDQYQWDDYLGKLKSEEFYKQNLSMGH